jgi:hypothetical protein
VIPLLYWTSTLLIGFKAEFARSIRDFYLPDVSGGAETKRAAEWTILTFDKPVSSEMEYQRIGTSLTSQLEFMTIIVSTLKVRETDHRLPANEKHDPAL